MSYQFFSEGQRFRLKKKGGKKDHGKIWENNHLSKSVFNYPPIIFLRVQPVEEPIQTKSTTVGDKECLKLMKYCDL